MKRDLLVKLFALSFLLGFSNSQEKSTSSSILSKIPTKLYDSSVEALRQKCMEIFPELRQDDLEFTTTETPYADPITTTVHDLQDETTTLTPLEPSNNADTIITTTTLAPLEPSNNAATIITTTEHDIETTTVNSVQNLPSEEPEPETTPFPTTTPFPGTTTIVSQFPTTTESDMPNNRQGKQLDSPDANLVMNSLPSASTDELIRLIMDLTKKIENLESTQRTLLENIDELQKKVENTPEVVKQKQTVTDLACGDTNTAIENWKDLAQNVSSADDLGNLTKAIVEEAFDKGAPPTGVMDFVNQIPDPTIQESCYGAVSDKLNGSEKAQEELYWKDMTPYCQQAAQNIGPDNPSTVKMYNVQNQIRLNAARPIALISTNIQFQEYQPAVFHWLTMVRDIPDSPPQLETNMKKMMLRTYAGNPVNLPFAFHFILILPNNQGFFKQVAYKCLTQEMKANGHYYNPYEQQQFQRKS